MTTSDQIDLSTYDPMDREVQQCPFDHYVRYGTMTVFLHEQSNMFFASRLDVVNEILRILKRSLPECQIQPQTVT